MKLGKLKEGILLGRRQRFFVDVALPQMEVVAHCANTGSMRSLLLPGTRALVAYVASPGRKLDWSLKLLRLPDSTLACVDTALPNRLVAEALAQGMIPGLPADSLVRPETVALPGSRLDFRVQPPEGPVCWIEVKNVTLVEETSPGLAQFPDAVTQRGLKHLETLMHLRAQGERAIILYLINRTDARSFAPAAHLDPAYAKGLSRALAQGVEALLCYTEIKEKDGEWVTSVHRVERYTG